MKKKFIASAMLAVAMATFTACAAQTPAPAPTTPGTPAPTAPAELPLIGATIYKFDDNFMSYVRRALETAATGKAKLELVDSTNDQARQGEQVDTFISKGVKALAINLVDPKAAPSIIAKAKAEDLPVIFFNKEPEESAMMSYDKAWYVGTESKESGIIQGEVVAKAWAANKDKWDTNKDGKIQYVLLKGEPGHPDAEARTTFVISTIKEKGIEVEELAIDTGMWDGAKASEKLQAWLAAYGEKIELVIANNDGMALGAITALEGEGYFKDGKFMPVVGVDAIPEALEMIKAGKLIGTVLNDAKNQAQATFDLTLNAANGKDVLDGTKWKLDGKKAVRVPYVAVTMENIKFAEDAYK